MERPTEHSWGRVPDAELLRPLPIESGHINLLVHQGVH